MSDETPRRVKDDAPVAPQGYRQTRRASKSAKAAKRAESQHKVSKAIGRGLKTTRDVGYYLAVALGALLVGVLVFVLVATAINGIVRWAAKNSANQKGSRADLESRARENVLIIGEQNDRATGFLAVRIDSANKQIYGVAIPDGAFIEVPGQGFERVGESYSSGAEVSLSAISNYLTVPFRTYVVVPAPVYSDAIKRQSLAGITAAATSSSVPGGSLEQLGADISAVPAKNTAIVPLPVKPIKLGTQTYFEPQRQQVADLLKSWWGIDPSQTAQATRVILYNGAGIAGIAGDAAQPLIRAGFRVVDTKNADNFKYATTKIIVQRGSIDQGNEIAKVLGVGTVSQQASDQDVADVIVIVGKDYKPPTSGKPGGK